MHIQTPNETVKNDPTGIGKLLSAIEKSGKHYDTEKIMKAYELARELHEGQYRYSGDPYISHPVAVAEIAVGLGLDTDSICAALLHDTVEDCGELIDLPMIKKAFGDDVAHRAAGGAPRAVDRCQFAALGQPVDVANAVHNQTAGISNAFAHHCPPPPKMRRMRSTSSRMAFVAAIAASWKYRPDGYFSTAS